MDIYCVPPPGPGPIGNSPPSHGRGAGSTKTTSTTIQVNPIIDTSKGDVPENNAIVTVKSSDGTVPTGRVFLDIQGYGHGSPFGHPLDAKGQTSYHLSTLPANTQWTLKAHYPGDSRFPASSTDDTKTVQVVSSGGGGGGGGTFATTTSINAPPVAQNPSGPTMAVITVTVSSSGGVPTGSVDLRVDGGAPIPATVTNGVATYHLTPSSGPGNYNLDATYNPTGSFLSSTGHSVLVVTGGGGLFATSTKISAPNINYGQSANITVTVSSSNRVPSGSVQLTVDHGQPMTSNLNSAGVAIFYGLTPSGGPGIYGLDATYIPAGSFAGSTDHLNWNVGGAGGGGGLIPVAISVSAIPSAMTPGEDPTATVTVSSTDNSGRIPAGTVLMHFDSFPGSPFPHSLDANGSTTYHLASLASQPPQTYYMWAEWRAQNGFAASQSTKQKITVTSQGGRGGPAQTQTLIVSIPSSVKANDSSQKAIVQVTAPGSPAPAGRQIKLSIINSAGQPYRDANGTTSPFVHFLGSDGTTIYTLGLPAGVYQIQAIFDGDNQYGPSSSDAKTLAVQ